jgi:hypothetical protein
MNKVFAVALVAIGFSPYLLPKPCRLRAIELKTVWSFKSLADAALAFIVGLTAAAVAMPLW